jgi:hypothetical protein
MPHNKKPPVIPCHKPIKIIVESCEINIMKAGGSGIFDERMARVNGLK